jgi:uncharacterized membrane protein YheB (UPF0754 family)
MKIANTEKMLKQNLAEEYGYLGHHWINERLNCGCIIAICLDVELNTEDQEFLIKNFNKKNALKDLIKECINSSNENISNHLERFLKEDEEAGNMLSQFIVNKRKEYNFPINIDCNSVYYYIKLYTDKNCKL